MTRILAIDDDSGRYDHLRRLLDARPGNRVELVIAACPDCVRPALAGAAAVLLDYDLDSGEPCPLCLASYGVWCSTSKGTAYIASHLDASFDAAGPSARLAVWYTFPKDAEWAAAGNAGPRWGPRTSGGAWVKQPHVGVGYHWRGWAEPVALFTKGATGRPSAMLGNGYVSAPEEHSAKPIPWMRQWIRAWTDSDDLVVDLYAGLGSVAVACALEGRRYAGAEIDEERHRRATLNIEQAGTTG